VYVAETVKHSNEYEARSPCESTSSPCLLLTNVVSTVFSELEIRHLRSNNTFKKSKQGIKTTYTAYTGCPTVLTGVELGSMMSRAELFS
jgi:hypothetical protein